MIILLTGLPGSGKTEVARFLAQKLGNARIIRNDELRRELFGVEGGRGFHENQTVLIDQAVVAKTKEGVAKGENIILDRVTPLEEKREWFKNLAKELESAFVIIAISSPELMIEERIKNRLKIDPLGVPFSAYLAQKEKYESVKNADYYIKNDRGLESLEKTTDSIIQQLRVNKIS